MALPAFLRPRKKYKPNLREPIKSWNIVKGDKVAVIDGPCKGQQGEVTAVLRDKKRIVIEGVNMRLKHLKKRYWETKGPTLMVPASLHYSNVNLVDPTNGLPTRVGSGFLEDGTKVRISKRTGAIIPKPEFKRPRPKNLVAGPRDTPAEEVLEVTYKPEMPMPMDAFPMDLAK
eukprot:CAMPEP_0172628914 /NCGR_PEP_ID=MMETSP1068-20121228/164590_1 /TAXON_ID=35684 /ORGANISM="Pseudopedinella elastica, Strain CCMP716" /LENGTH=172 /DNA_ID=CAMNT_0013439291 /DNA_START=270 /DNA_END=788 /DNA_ORIENTATION=+